MVSDLYISYKLSKSFILFTGADNMVNVRRIGVAKDAKDGLAIQKQFAPGILFQMVNE